MHTLISSSDELINRNSEPINVSIPQTTNELPAPSPRPPPRCISLEPKTDSTAPLPVVIREVPSELRTWKITREGLVEVNSGTMGAFLDKPKTNKSNITGEGKDIRYAIASMQGWRIDMEDAHVVEISMADKEPFKDWAFFAVFDGHAGNVAAEQSAEHILKTLLETKEFDDVRQILCENGSKLNERSIELLESGMKTGFMALDNIIRSRRGCDFSSLFTDGSSIIELAAKETDRSGTTAVCAILTPTHIIIANLGDSRAVVSRAGESSIGTEDHKPYLEKERERIVGAGGSVMIQRINGSLAVSRALGDFDYKAVPGLCPTKQLVSCEPDIYVIPRKQDLDQFMVLACDGIYDDRLQVSPKLEDVCNQVLDACLHRGSRDNMTIILICFQNAPKLDEEKREKEETWAVDMRQKFKVLRRLSAKVETDTGPAPHRLRTIIDQVLTEKGITHDH
ncbi:unnamed protein product, partial [Mesorhabditis belari]|uniref:PPM-type phosphatase domain-containing protein n=1 Tax=Mesorhabditis belari TaxID=2138241 RepID=A0AAF3J3G9_9BILA